MSLIQRLTFSNVSRSIVKIQATCILNGAFPTRSYSDGEGMFPPTKGKTPVGKLDNGEQEFDKQTQHVEKEPLERFPDGINPKTGEHGGPRGPEPTRYGDWERKGRCVDF